jgi:signal transduction histidine kinase/ligand-binding sensor domain-containing protein
VLTRIEADFAKTALLSFPLPGTIVTVLQALRFCLVCALLWQSVGGLFGAASDVEFDVKVWETDEGLPHNTVLSMVQAQDGHLWVGTYDGLVRFNGIQFTNLTPWLNDRVSHLFEDSRRTLWIGTENRGTILFKDGQLTMPKELSFTGIDRRLRSSCEDAQGAVWLYYENGEIWRCAAGRFSKFNLPSQREPGGTRAMICETNGAVWIGTLLNQYRVGSVAENAAGVLPVAETVRIGGLGVEALVASRHGGFWRVANTQVQLIRDGVTHYIVNNYPWKLVATAFCEDKEGNLVVASLGAEIFTVRTNGVVTQLSTNAPNTLVILADRESSIWAGSDGFGLRVVKRENFRTLEKSRNWLVQSLAEDARGNLWIGGAQGFGLGRWTRTNDLLQSMQMGSSPEPIQCVFVDSKQRAWVASARGAALYQFAEEEYKGFDPEGTIQHIVHAIHEDRAGRMWFGTAGGLVRLESGVWKRFDASDGLSSTNITALAGAANGDLWIGTRGGGINRWHDGKFSALRRTDGAPSDDVSGLVADANGVVWVTTPGGLGRYHEGKWTRYTKREGLVSDDLGSLIDDGKGNLWMASHDGLLHLPKQALNEVAAGAARTIPCRAYGKKDGLPTAQCTFGSQPNAWLGKSNILWFSTAKGVASLNVARFRPNTNPPPVAIESILVDDVPQKLTQEAGGADSRTSRITLQPTESRIEVYYASLNLSGAERSRFRYWLEGWDKDWIDADTTRIARYNKLPAGDYTFHVTASNEDGVWNPTGTSFTLTVLPTPPPFWRTWWFLTFGPLALIGIIIGIVYYISTQKLQQQLAVLRQQEALQKERARIARDIHDQVGASLTQVALLGELVETDKDLPEEVELHGRQISQTARETTRALDEIVWTVNPQNDTLEGLVNYICKNAQDYLAVAGVRYRFDVPPQVPALPLPPDVRHNVFLASKEAVTNVVKHSKATSAWLRMKLENELFTVEIEDNGRGVAGLDLNAPRTRNGLKNMRKRMEDVGGTFHLGPGSESGALVRLTVPLARLQGA